MTYGAKLNIALAVALAAMLLVAWLTERDAEHLQPMLAEFDATSVTTVRIERPGREPLAFERMDDGWHMQLPLQLAVDARRLEEIVNSLSVPSEARYPARELPLDELGLGDPPRARVVVDGEAFMLGDTNPVNRLRYVQRGEVVHLVADLLYFRLGGEPYSWAHRQPLPAGSRVARIETDSFSVARTEDGWALSPENPAVTPEALQRVVDAWANAQAFEVTRAEPGGPEDPRVQVWLDGADAPLEFTLRRTEEFMAVVRADLGIEFHVPLYRADDLWVVPQAQD